jgi:hypothetical protein
MASGRLRCRIGWHQWTPDFIGPVERLTRQPMGQGTGTDAITAELLELLGEPYRAAAQT